MALLLPKPLFTELKRTLGQVAAGKVVKFTPHYRKKWISLPSAVRSFDQLEEFEICGDSLENLYIFDGDSLICRTNFTPEEITPARVCIIRLVNTNDYKAKRIKCAGDGVVLILSDNPKYQTEAVFENEIEVLALAIEHKRAI